jgi:hypothetical protein
MYRKNVAGQFVEFQGVDATTGGIKSGVTWTMRRCIDGTFAAGGGTVTEDGTTGWYKCALAQADTNGNNIGFNFTGTGAIPQTVNIVTTACDPTTATNFGITALPAVASGSAGAVLVDGTGTAAISNSSGKVLLQATQSGVTIPTVTTVTNQLTAAAIATGIWQDATAGDFTAANSIGKSVMNGVALGTGLDRQRPYDEDRLCTDRSLRPGEDGFPNWRRDDLDRRIQRSQNRLSGWRRNGSYGRRAHFSGRRYQHDGHHRILPCERRSPDPGASVLRNPSASWRVVHYRNDQDGEAVRSLYDRSDLHAG